MRTIPLHKDGYFAICDDEYYDSLKDYKWFVIHDKNTHYAIRTYRINKRRFTLSMHRQIMNAVNGELIDHRDGNGLHCCKSNLRSATNSQNSCNQTLRKNNWSGVKGVSSRHGRWRACITVNYKQRELGSFKTFEEAVAARKNAEKELHGEFARAD